MIRTVWTTDDISFEGKHFTARGITAHPRPITRPHPPIWIGGNTSSARQRVARHGDGWCPFPAPARLANTAGTAVIESNEDLVAGIDDLRRRCDAAGKDWTAIDITFTNFDGGDPNSDDVQPRRLPLGLGKVGGTGCHVGIGGRAWRQPGAALESLDRFRLLSSTRCRWTSHRSHCRPRTRLSVIRRGPS